MNERISATRRLFVMLAFPVLGMAVITPNDALAAVRLKDIAHVAGTGRANLFGYGLVVGLEGTGDGQGTKFTVQTLTSMLRRMGITVDPEQVKVKNVAAVMVTASLSPLAVRGERFDVTVSSIGDAKSLRGGTLLLTPLASADGTVHATAQGPVSTGGFAVEAQGGAGVTRNYSMVGRVPGGATLEEPLVRLTDDPTGVELALLDPDWTTAQRVAAVIAKRWGPIAEVSGPASVRVSLPADYAATQSRAAFIAELESLSVEPDDVARVVINEKTGTIVAGQHVSIAPVAIAHGGITVQIQSQPVISQPAPLSQGQTVVETQSAITVSDEEAHVVSLPGSTTIQEVAESLNAIGATPRDIIAIFQALREAGALRAELVIL
ncbi:MAG: flagellar basal body P-ring protein FlgI [Candidatus Zixiibacteriota bacterium]